MTSAHEMGMQQWLEVRKVLPGKLRMLLPAAIQFTVYYIGRHWLQEFTVKCEEKLF